MISVIVPVYKTARFLERCIDSLLNQTYKDFELILIDDGSPDNSGIVCDRYKKLDQRVVVIHQENMGLASVRNVGLDWVFQNSESEWITFVDSDDFVHPQMLELLYSNIKDTSQKLIVGDFVRFSHSDDILIDTVDISEITAITMAPEDFYVHDSIVETTAWGKLYHRSCFETIRYPDGKLHEDNFTTYKIIFSLDSVLHLEYPIYFYYTNPNGIMNSWWTPDRLVVFEAYQEQLDFFEEKGYLIARDKIASYYAHVLYRQIQEVSRHTKYRAYLGKMQKMLQNHLKRYSDVDRIRNSRKYGAYQAACSRKLVVQQSVDSAKGTILRLGITKNRKINRLGKPYFKNVIRRINKDKAILPIDFPIDFVVTWVDGSDPEWLKEKNRYLCEYDPQTKNDNPSMRFRDWDTMRYWFRAVEKYAPWVNRVFFVTCGQIPEWLNTDHPKLRIINHSDYIPEEYLPTFSSHTIENNLWRIEELSEHFVYFNDDMFLGSDVKPEDFFANGYPKLCALARPNRPTNKMVSFEHALLNNLGEINSRFDMNAVISKHPEKWLDDQFTNYFEYNSRVYQDGFLTGMYFSHVCVPFRKSSMQKCFETFYDIFHLTSTHKFRSYQDVNHQLFQLWEMVNGTFEPVERGYHGKWLSTEPETINLLEKQLDTNHYRCFCLNDSEKIAEEDFPEFKKIIHRILGKDLTDPSSYEKSETDDKALS